LVIAAVTSQTYLIGFDETRLGRVHLSSNASLPLMMITKTTPICAKILGAHPLLFQSCDFFGLLLQDESCVCGFTVGFTVGFLRLCV
jgi:hypothetical protein